MNTLEKYRNLYQSFFRISVALTKHDKIAAI